MILKSIKDGAKAFVRTFLAILNQVITFAKAFVRTFLAIVNDVYAMWQDNIAYTKAQGSSGRMSWKGWSGLIGSLVIISIFTFGPLVAAKETMEGARNTAAADMADDRVTGAGQPVKVAPQDTPAKVPGEVAEK